MECKCPGSTSTHSVSTEEIEGFTILEHNDNNASMDFNRVTEAHKATHSREQAEAEWDNEKAQQAEAQSRLNTEFELQKTKFELHGAKAELNYANFEINEARTAMNRAKTAMNCAKSAMNRAKAKFNKAKPQLKETDAELVNTTKNELISTKTALKTANTKFIETEAELEALNTQLEAKPDRNGDCNLYLYACGIAVLLVILLVAYVVSLKGNISPTTNYGPCENILKAEVERKFENMAQILRSQMNELKEGMGRTLKSETQRWTDINGRKTSQSESLHSEMQILNGKMKSTMGWELAMDQNVY